VSQADVKFIETDCNDSSGNALNVFNSFKSDNSGNASLGLPYGAFQVCVDDNSAGHRLYTTFTNDTASGKSLGTITIDDTKNSQQGQCPS
jgi:hypothetical protein